MLDFSAYLTTIPADIDRRLQDYLAEWVKDTAANSPVLHNLCQSFADACADGKRLRAALVALGFEMVSGATNPEIYRAALAYEIFQTAILAHDDIIDNSPLRRGRPTLFKVLEKHCATHFGPDKNAAHYGISQTICLGDMGLYLAIQLINDCAFDPVLKNKAVSSFTQTVLDTIVGELIDVELPYLPDQSTITETDLLKICQYKTARYTITGPLSLGAILGNASAYTLDAIKDYGDNLGIAFQIKDDLLGIFGDEKTIGKSVTSDIEEGKTTILYLYAMRHADAAQTEFLKAHYGTGTITPETHTQIKDIFTTTGALHYAETLMQNFADKANQAIPQVTANDAYRTLLCELADYMIKRVK